MQIRQLALYIFGLFAAGVLQAQTSLLTERLRGTLSPSEIRYNSRSADMDVRKLRQMYANPAFHELVRQEDSLFRTGRYHSSVSTTYSNGRVEGDFLPYEGNSFEDFRLAGSGEYSLPSAGTLFGSVQYARGKHEGIGWNAMRYSELYLPYISTDSIGGNFHFEDYQVEGGYAFQLAGWMLGVHGSFHGEQAYRKSDPRALNNTTWLNIGIGAARLFNGHLFMLQGGFGRNKQHMSLRYWRPGQQDRFFVCYGFGLYDVRQSAVLFGYSRMYYIKEGNVRFAYQSPAGHPFTLYAGVGYDYDRMKTEESDIRDLYYSRTHSFSPTLRIDWKPSSSLLVSLWLESNIDRRKGYENIFEQYLADEANNIYDFRLIDTQQKYIFNKSESLAQLRLRYQLNSSHSVGLQAGTSYFLREEIYKKENYNAKNASLFPYGRIDYRLVHKRSELELAFLYGKQIGISNEYNVVMNNQSLQHLDFQHAFAPYAYYDSRFSSIQLTATYVHHFSKFGIGVNFKFMYTSGERDEDAFFRQEVGFASSAPMVTVSPDKHDEHWGSGSLFFVF